MAAPPRRPASSLDELNNARRAVLTSDSSDSCGHDRAVARLLKAEAAVGESFRSHAWSRSTMPNVQSAKRLISHALSSVRAVPGSARASSPDRCVRTVNEAPHRPQPEQQRHARGRDGSVSKKHTDKKHDGKRKRKHHSLEEETRKRRKRRQSGSRDAPAPARASSTQGADACAGGLTAQTSIEDSPPTTNAVESHSTHGAPAAASSPLWARKGMRVRLIPNSSAGRPQTAVVLAARNAEHLILRPDDGEGTAVRNEMSLLPARPKIGGLAIVFGIEQHEGEVGKVVRLSVAEKVVTLRLQLGELTCSLDDVCEWAPREG